MKRLRSSRRWWLVLATGGGLIAAILMVLVLPLAENRPTPAPKLPDRPRAALSVPTARMTPAPRPTAANPYLASLSSALKLTDSAARLAALRQILGAWAEADPRAALFWARDQTGNLREDAMRMVLVAAARAPDDVLPEALGIFSRQPELLTAVGGEFVAALVANQRFSTVPPLIALASAEMRRNWVTLTFQRWAADDPAAAFDALALLPEDQRAAGFDSLVSGWAAVRPAQVAEYALALPPGPERDRTISVVIENLSLQDPAALAVWLTRQPASPALDPAAASLVLRADSVNRTPEVALQWAQRIFDPGLREQAVTHALRELARKDPPSVSAYLAGLPPSSRARIQGLLSVPAPD